MNKSTDKKLELLYGVNLSVSRGNNMPFALADMLGINREYSFHKARK